MLQTEIKTYDILLVEDNQDDVYLTDLAIKELNIRANLLVINNGKLAIQLIESMIEDKKKLPDLILLDINLPKVNGLEVLKQIRLQPTSCKVPIVMFTSADSVSDMTSCYSSGADLYIRKPNNLNDFKESITYIMNYCFEA